MVPNSLPVQLVPSPVKPTLQVQKKLPTVFVQLALVSQPPNSSKHSLTSAYINKNIGVSDTPSNQSHKKV